MQHAIITHKELFKHIGTPGYQETPDRLKSVLDAITDLDLIHVNAPLASQEDLLRVHPKEHISNISQNIPLGQIIALDYDTALDHFTANAANRAVGAVCAAVAGVMSNTYSKVFCATRPPGHHAEPERAMGFCYYSNVAIGALKAQQQFGLERIAIVDFDVHHGNGTQKALAGNPHIYFASIHQHPHYPNTGDIVNIPNIRNIPLPGGTSSKTWRREFEDKILTDLHKYKPQLLFVSAGFDAHENDPLGEFNLQYKDYAWLGDTLGRVADTYCKGRLISVLEGGYNLAALGQSTRTYIAQTLGNQA